MNLEISFLYEGENKKMQLPDELLTVFSAEIYEQDSTPVVNLPEQELEIGDLEVGDSYRIAVLSQPDTEPQETAENSDGVEREQKGPGRPVSRGEQLEVEIEDIGEKGDGIARVGPGYIVFVSGTEIGDRVTIEVTQAQENYAFADVVKGEPISG